jgi:hypothetical protein
MINSFALNSLARLHFSATIWGNFGNFDVQAPGIALLVPLGLLGLIILAAVYFLRIATR